MRGRVWIGLVRVLIGAGLVLGISAVGALGGGQAALADSACTISWAGPASGGLWATAANWNLARTPTAGDVVCISRVTGTVTFDGSNGTSTTLIAELRSSAPLSITGGELGLTDTSATGNTVGGFSMSGGQLGDTTNDQGSLTDAGNFSWTGGGFYAPTAQSPQPTLTVSSGHTATLVSNNDFYDIEHWTLSIASPLTYSGNSALVNGASFTASGTATLADGADITSYFGSGGPFTVTGTGTLTKAATTGTATVGTPVINAGTVRAGGGVLSLISLTNTGRLDLSTGVVSLSSAYAPAKGSKLEVTIGGTTAGTTYGQLQVAGTTTLDGSLVITTASGFTPAAGQAFTITTSSGTSSGKFTGVKQSITSNGLAYKPKYSSAGVSLTAVKATDLALKASAPATAAPGSPVDYSATATNNGPNADTKVSVTFALPSGVTFVSASPGCTQSGAMVTCDQAGTLAAGAKTSFSVDTTATDSGQQTATISTKGALFDPDQANNTVKLTTTIS
jgi:uncharacterized repeat protein (TIGR01451 family)